MGRDHVYNGRPGLVQIILLPTPQGCLDEIHVSTPHPGVLRSTVPEDMKI